MRVYFDEMKLSIFDAFNALVSTRIPFSRARVDTKRLGEPLFPRFLPYLHFIAFHSKGCWANLPGLRRMPIRHAFEARGLRFVRRIRTRACTHVCYVC